MGWRRMVGGKLYIFVRVCCVRLVFFQRFGLFEQMRMGSVVLLT